jgi:hypothetical protein
VERPEESGWNAMGFSPQVIGNKYEKYMRMLAEDDEGPQSTA